MIYRKKEGRKENQSQMTGKGNYAISL